MFSDFRDFIAKGNVMDMAVGIIIGAAFTAIVKSMVDDLLNPIIGLFLGGVDFTNLFMVLSGDGTYASLEAARDAGVSVFAYGAFTMALINFIIIACVVFILVRTVNKVKDASARKAVEEAPSEHASSTELDILKEIRDALQKS